MKIHLVLAPAQTKPGLSSIMYDNYPPLGILYIAAYLRRHAQDVVLKATDGLLEGWDKTVEEIDRFGPDIVFVSFLTPFALSAYKFVDRLKVDHPETLIALGGPHATALPYEAFEMSRCDVVVAGEGEETSLELVNAVARHRSLEGINGVYWRNGNDIVANPPRAFIKKLDDIPFPARDLVDMKRYREWFWVKSPPETTILLSRGCPFNCSFCSNRVWKSSRPALRLRSARNIVDEMEHLQNTYSIRSFFDGGDEFNNNVKHAIAICKEIISRRLKVDLKASIRAHPLPEELVSLMAQAGFWWVQMGIESANQATIDGIKKHITLDQVDQALRLLKKYKIRVRGLFMLFHFWEENDVLKYEAAEDSLRTVGYAKKLIDKRLVSCIQSSITTPYPGSQLHRVAERHQLFRNGLDKSYDRWLEDDFVVRLPGVTLKEASDVYFKASLLRSYGYLRSGTWRLRDIPILARKFGRVVTVKAAPFLQRASK